MPERFEITTAEEARKEFKTFEGTTQRGYPYTGYEYDGQWYHDIAYLRCLFQGYGKSISSGKAIREQWQCSSSNI